jgi:hypothetical protein
MGGDEAGEEDGALGDNCEGSLPRFRSFRLGIRGRGGGEKLGLSGPTAPDFARAARSPFSPMRTKQSTGTESSKIKLRHRPKAS